jgi:hypothetical protein
MNNDNLKINVRLNKNLGCTSFSRINSIGTNITLSRNSRGKTNSFKSSANLNSKFGNFCQRLGLMQQKTKFGHGHWTICCGFLEAHNPNSPKTLGEVACGQGLSYAANL